MRQGQGRRAERTEQHDVVITGPTGTGKTFIAHALAHPACRSAILTSQLPVEHWHDHPGEATVADAICDWLPHDAHRIAFKGPS